MGQYPGLSNYFQSQTKFVERQHTWRSELRSEFDSSFSSRPSHTGSKYPKTYDTKQTKKPNLDPSARSQVSTATLNKRKYREENPWYRKKANEQNKAYKQAKRTDEEFKRREAEKMKVKRTDEEFKRQEAEKKKESMRNKRTDDEFKRQEAEKRKESMRNKRTDDEFKRQEAEKKKE